MKKLPIVIVILAVSLGSEGIAFAQHLGLVGSTVRAITSESKTRWLVDFPVMEIHLPTEQDRMDLTLQTVTTFDTKKCLPVDFGFGLGARWNLGARVALFTQASVGTFFFNNYVVAGSAGMDLRLPFNGGELVVGLEYFRRNSKEWLGYYGGQRFASGSGIGIRLGFDRYVHRSVDANR